MGAAPKWLEAPASVKLAASVLFHIPTGSKLRGSEPKDAYHTSIIVDDVEYLFDDAGVERCRYFADRRPVSHSVLDSETKIVHMGSTTIDPLEMMRALRQLFAPGSYDLIRKNCNSFCDCALFYLLSVRLDPRYRELERIAKWGQKNFGLMNALKMTGLRYHENPRAADFKVDDAVRKLAALRGVPYAPRPGAEEPPKDPPSSGGGMREYCSTRCLGRMTMTGQAGASQ